MIVARRLVFALALALAFPAAATAQTRIVATVNGEPITSYEVAQRQRLLQITGARGDVRDQALEELISEKVQVRAARAAGVSASEGEVDRAVADIASRVKLSPPQLAQALGQAGVNIDALRERLRVQIIFSRLVRARFMQRGAVTEQDLVHALRKSKEGKEGAEAELAIETAEYDLTQIIIALPNDPSPERIAQAQKTAAGLRSEFTSCSQGIEKAKGTRNVVVRPYGRRTASELSPDARAALEETAIGRLAAPLPGPRGLVLFAVCDKKTMKSTNAAMKALEDDITSERGENFMKQYMRQLRRDALIETF